MDQLHSSVCILGGGPAALLSQVLLRKRGLDVCTVAGSMLGNLTPLQIGGVRLSPIPIFVKPDSYLFQRMEWGPLSEDDHVTTAYSPMSSEGVTEEIFPGSYAEFMVQRYSDAAQRLVITKKHLGTDVFRENFPGLRRKVLSNYPPGHPAAKRVGFCDGVSLYLRYLEREQFCRSLKGAVQAIDIVRKCVVTNSHRITYDRLISTLPLLDFLALARISTPLTTVAASARIVVAIGQQLTKANQLVYDCDVTSPVHRVFVPRAGFFIVQVARPNWDIDEETIARRVQALFDLPDRPIILKRLTVQNCYPLAVSDYALRDAMLGELDRANVTLFGRFAEWEYRDIEELNWERIECLS